MVAEEEAEAGIRTLVKQVFVLLALLSAASGRVELVADTAKEAATLLVLAGGGLLLLLLLVTAGELVDEVHGCRYGVGW